MKDRLCLWPLRGFPVCRGLELPRRAFYQASDSLLSGTVAVRCFSMNRISRAIISMPRGLVKYPGSMA